MVVQAERHQFYSRAGKWHSLAQLPPSKLSFLSCIKSLLHSFDICMGRSIYCVYDLSLELKLSSYVRLLPSYKLHKKLAKEVGHSRCRISYRISNTRQSFPHEAGLDQIHLNGDLSQGLKEYNFGTMETPFGYEGFDTFMHDALSHPRYSLSNLHVMYRTACDFTFEMDYSGLSDKMVDFDDAYFRTRVIPTPLRRNFSSQHFDDFSSRRVPIRKSSQASLNSERSSDGPPRSFTSPSTTDFRPASVKAQDATLFSHRSSYASGSLPSPSYMAFTPPSVPSSFKFESTAPLFKDTPPFCLTNAVGDFSVKDIVNPDASPPFAIVGVRTRRYLHCMCVSNKVFFPISHPKRHMH